MVAPGDIIGQTEQIMKNMQAILEEAGSDLAHIIKTMVFVKDIEDFAKFNEAYKNSSQIIRRQEALCKSVIF